MVKKYLECGKIVSSHGVRGDLRVQPWCDSPEFLRHFSTLYLERGDKPVTVRSLRVQGNMLLLGLEGVNTMEQAASLRGETLYIDRKDAPSAGDGEFFVQDIIGISVHDADNGTRYGVLTDVFFTGANDVYEITGPDGAKRLIPAIRQVVVNTDIENGVMNIRPLKGLLDDED